MKGLNGLFINEVIKVKKQKSLIIAMCVVLVLSVAVSVLSVVAESEGYSHYTLQAEYENQKQYCESNEFDNEYQKAYFHSIVACLELFIENGITERNDYRWKRCGDSVGDLFDRQAFLQLYLDGYTDLDSHRNWFWDLVYQYTGGDEYEDEKPTAETSENGELHLDFDVAAELERVNTEIETYSVFLKTNDTYSYHKGIYESALAEIERMKEELSTYGDSDMLKYAEKDIERAEKKLVFYKLMMDKNVDITKYSWEDKTLDIVDTVLSQKYGADMYTEQEFNEILEDTNNGGGVYFGEERFKEYGKYVEAYEYVMDECDDAYNILLYSMENGVPTHSALENSASGSTEWQMTVFMSSFISVFAFVLFGSVLANEFTQGTVRLLLIRPRYRYKILTSKILSSMLYVTALSLTATVICHIINSIAYGNGSVPYLYAVGDRVVSVPTVAVLFARLVLELIPLFTLCMVSVLLSVLTKRSVLSISLPMMLYVTSPLVKLIMVESFGLKLKYYIGSQLHLSSYLDNTVVRFGGGEVFDIMDILFGKASDGVIPDSLGVCLVIVGIYLAVLTVISYVTFSKTEIKG